ncbi:HET-domain-containing protein [Xylaria bambusicola]|uniref:HET-domain-containing protein n=1 Tax=Xylaria bambusicola TaxID=326684 RepID=UPI00200839BC|nr:HET-domain-containing protein [Xylaria bambusicola]KAI0513252.1 HET-domain-containing protein [Xylaria bambusicola]
MYLLNTETYELRSGLQPTFRQEGYAILSHRWVGQEITFDQLKDETLGLRFSTAPARTPQVDKICGAAQTARDLGIKWIWIDSCCVDRANAVEQTESINSMFKWYRDAKVCIAYLSDVQKQEPHNDVPTPERFDSLERQGPSIWFSRGWTLQELLAPRNMRFYDKDWNFIGTKITQSHTLERITGIDSHYLTGEKHFATACIATKMSWMAGRTTTRIEDIAYSMLGIFNITMATQYGEGIRAFMRLQETLLSTSRDESLFAWRMPERDAGIRSIRDANQDIAWDSDEWGLLALSPDWFKDSAHVTTEHPPDVERPLKSFEMTQGGIIAPISKVYWSRLYQCLLIIGVTVPVGLVMLPFIGKSQVKRSKLDFECPLRCRLRNITGTQALVRIYLRPLSSGYKRIRACEFGRGDIPKNVRSSKWTERAIVFQPAIGYLD